MIQKKLLNFGFLPRKFPLLSAYRTSSVPRTQHFFFRECVSHTHTKNPHFLRGISLSLSSSSVLFQYFWIWQAKKRMVNQAAGFIIPLSWVYLSTTEVCLPFFVDRPFHSLPQQTTLSLSFDSFHIQLVFPRFPEIPWLITYTRSWSLCGTSLCGGRKTGKNLIPI